MPERNLALCFLRLSSRGKQEISIDMQRNRCAAECERLGLVPVFYEEGLGRHSANTRKNLPEWDKLYKRALTDPAVYCVMGYDHERAFRNVSAARQSAEQLAKVGVKLIFTVSGEVDTTTAHGKMVYTMQAAFAEHYSNYVSEKLYDHFAELKAEGVYAGHRAPQGLKRVGKAKQVKLEKSDDLKTIEEWFTLYTTQDIGTPRGAAILTAAGFKWRNRQGELREVSADDLVTALANLEMYKPHLAPALYRAVKRRKAQRAQHRANGNQTIHPPLLLRGILFCAACGAPYVCTHQVNRAGNLVSTYRHRRRVHCASVRCPAATLVERLVWSKLATIEWTDELKRSIVSALVTPPDLSQVLDLKQARDKLAQRLKGFQVMLADGDISRAQFLQFKSEIERDMEQLPEITVPVSDPLSEEEAWRLVEDIVHFLSNPELGTPQAKNKAMQVVFEKVILSGERGAAGPTVQGQHYQYHIEVVPQPLFEKVFNVG